MKATVYTIRYSDGTKFHWTLWGYERVPLIKTGETEFKPVHDNESQIALCVLCLKILELPLGQHSRHVAEHIAQKQEAEVRGTEMRCFNHWAAVVFSSSGMDAAYCRQAVISCLSSLTLRRE